MVREVRGIYSEVGRRGVSGNGVIVVLEVREVCSRKERCKR